MALIDTAQVCDLLGISKSTLYRWCDVSDYDEKRVAFAVRNSEGMRFGVSDIPEQVTDFPKPFRIGRALKWEENEIRDWLETRRVR
ncbi:helix-turn-helix domain-containing protein [Aliivibrio fischeri]|uniref:helix-turn-helix transcriptional regulator n=1 Tax=Aliivibrio fischeri TaxID=668 RepID=UPI0012DA60E2|nr:helix-turn-helix domain-containing protein [Aliivibrio fischeri]MUK94675.1 helix-turn-helix domain-containing protein [Aliivibrio fischeri]